jgi:hypothetical protein
MTKVRLGGLLLLLLSSGFFIFLGSSLERTVPGGMADFKGVYYGTRCLLHGCDHYRQSELLRFYQAEGGDRPSDAILQRQGVTLYVNLPSTFIVLAPFALLPWGAAHVLWMTLMAASLTLAAFLMWNIEASRAPGISLFLICFLLANCEIVLAGGNAAGIVVSLCVVAVWCFLRERLVLAGVLCMAVSLAIKPHDAGLVWLYFLLAGGVYRKRALQTLVVIVVLGLPGILWVSHVAPHWLQEMHSNLMTISAHGGLNDPGAARVDERDPNTVIDLQTVISVFWDDPRIYNPATYAVCGPLLLMWMLVTLRARVSTARTWLALAAITSLSMLLTYHRPYDAKLLLLTVPACAILWAEGGPIGWLALLVNTAGIVLTGDIPLIILRILADNLHIPTAGLSGQILKVTLTRPVPLVLLAMGIFYLWVYVRRADPDAERGVA